MGSVQLHLEKYHGSRHGCPIHPLPGLASSAVVLCKQRSGTCLLVQAKGGVVGLLHHKMPLLPLLHALMCVHGEKFSFALMQAPRFVQLEVTFLPQDYSCVLFYQYVGVQEKLSYAKIKEERNTRWNKKVEHKKKGREKVLSSLRWSHLRWKCGLYIISNPRHPVSPALPAVPPITIIYSRQPNNSK